MDNKKSIILGPLVVERMEFCSKPFLHDLKLEIKSTFTVQNISSNNEAEANCAVINCDLQVFSKDADWFKLSLSASAALECHVGKVSFKNVVEQDGIPRFMEELRKLVAELTKDLGYPELKI